MADLGRKNKRIILITLFIFFMPFSLTAEETGETGEEYETKFKTPPCLAILPFNNTNTQAVESGLGQTVAAMLTTSLISKTNFVVIERSKIRSIIEEKEFGLSGLTAAVTKQFRDLYKVDVLVSGEVSFIEKMVQADIRLIDTQTSEVVAATFGKCDNLAEIRNMTDELARDLELQYLRPYMGEVSVLSEPSEAEVYINDKYYGKTETEKPLVIPNFLSGNYRAKLVRPGYFDWEGEIKVLPKMKRNIKIPLTAKPGSLSVSSEPEKAGFYLDNKLYGETPLVLKNVAEGEHEIKLVLKNYKDWTSKVTVHSFQPSNVRAKMEILPGEMVVNSTPAGAELIYQGKYVGLTPFTLRNITPGEVVVSLKKEGYRDWAEAVVVEPNQTRTLDINLENKEGFLEVTSQPEAAEVFLVNYKEKKLIGKTPVLNYKTAIGLYEVLINKENYYFQTKAVNIKDGQFAEVKAKLEAKPGSLKVVSSPLDARVLVNGRYFGRAPLFIEDFPPGEYRVRLETPTRDYETQAVLKINEVTEVNKDFDKSTLYINRILFLALSIIVLGFGIY